MIDSLQIGSSKPRGIYREPRWVNVDIITHRPRGHFVQGDGAELPFADRQFRQIHAIHVLEHLPRDRHLPMLREIARVLHRDGSAWIEVPDFLSVVRMLVDAASRGQHEETRIRTVGVFGKGRHEGDFHHWGFAPWYLEALIREAGMEPQRSHEMISGHHRQEPVLLYRCTPEDVRR